MISSINSCGRSIALESLVSQGREGQTKKNRCMRRYGGLSIVLTGRCCHRAEVVAEEEWETPRRVLSIKTFTIPPASELRMDLPHSMKSSATYPQMTGGLFERARWWRGSGCPPLRDDSFPPSRSRRITTSHARTTFRLPTPSFLATSVHSGTLPLGGFQAGNFPPLTASTTSPRPATFNISPCPPCASSQTSPSSSRFSQHSDTHTRPYPSTPPLSRGSRLLRSSTTFLVSGTSGFRSQSGNRSSASTPSFQTSARETFYRRAQGSSPLNLLRPVIWVGGRMW